MHNVKNLRDQTSVDVLVIGGGINGTGVARDAAGRGFKVLLCEQHDLAQHTSSSSTKLIHGGLRYLEQYDFKLVRQALREREILLRSAPHIVWPLRFILPHHNGLRPKWLLRIGLFLYDNIGGRVNLPKSFQVDLTKHQAGAALQDRYQSGFEYSDCWVQDARMAVLNSLDAASNSATIFTRTRCVKLKKNSDYWNVTLQQGDESYQVYAKSVVNAAGPWVENVDDMCRSVTSNYKIRLVKGSHIVVKKQFNHDYAYLFQNHDNRVLFAIPYEKDYTLLGTTDLAYTDDPAAVEISQGEIEYICSAANKYFQQAVHPSDVVYSYSGVRPLFDDAATTISTTTRDYVLNFDFEGPPMVSIYGGKLTTYRKLSEQVVDRLLGPLNHSAPAWTENAILPGGDFAGLSYDAYLGSAKRKYHWCSEELVEYIVRNYGSSIEYILEDKSSMQDLGACYGAQLYQAEVDYLVEHEWAKFPEDVLYRRTRAALHGGEATIKALSDAWKM